MAADRVAAHEEEAGGGGEDGSGPNPNRACEVKAAQDAQLTSAAASCRWSRLELEGVRLKSARSLRFTSVFLFFFIFFY